MDQIKLSVIVPVYNVEKYLGKCMDSILNQTLKDIEVILVDDESPDSSGAMCDEYARLDSRVQVIHKKNGGLGMARNSGIELARGEYITFVDSDDYIDRSLYERVYALAKNHDLDIMRFSYNKFVKEGSFSKVVKNGDLTLYTDKADIRQIALCLFSSPMLPGHKDLNLGGSAWSAIYHRKFFFEHNLRFPSERKMLSEDFYFAYQVLQRAERYGRIPDTLYHYRFTPMSLTTKPTTDFVEKTADFAMHLEKMFIADGYPEESRFYAMSYSMDILRAKLKNVFLSDMPQSEMRRWFAEKSGHPYFARVAEEFPLGNIRSRHRIGFESFVHGRFNFLYSLVVGQEHMRRVARKMNIKKLKGLFPLHGNRRGK